jgi:hypothetical protein
MLGLAAMEKLFLRIARGTLVAVIALSLLLTVIAAVYGAIQFYPSKQPKAPEIKIALNDIISSKSSASSTEATSGESDSEKKFAASKECETTASKINQLSAQIGWDKKSNQAFNPSTMQFETRNSVDYNESVDVNRFCKVMQNLIDENNSKLSPYFKQIDLKQTYFSNFSGLLDEMLTDADKNKKLSLNDSSRYYTVTAIESFNNQFSKAVDKARDSASQKEDENTAKKVKGKAALFMAGTAFAFFFACCMTLVFIRIEANTRDLVDAVRAVQNKEQASILP